MLEDFYYHFLHPFIPGFGVCCTFLVSTCGSTLDQNCTYIQNPSYPSSYSTSGSCSYSITPLHSEICQIRLDMDTFDITDAAAGTCTDSFDITVGSSRDYYTLCGTLTGQHSKLLFWYAFISCGVFSKIRQISFLPLVYLETARQTTSQTLSFTIATASTVSQWRIKVSQIECYSRMK